MEEQTASLLAALKKPSTPVDTRLQLFNNLKSGIKHNRVPESCQAPVFECIRIAISATTSAALVASGFSTLSHFLKRLQLQRETSIVTSQSHKLLAILIDRLGDARESHRHAASQLLADLHQLCHTDVEAVIHSAMKGTNPRAKEASMQWLVKMNKTDGLPFRGYVPQLVVNLEDADAGVRETAKTTVVELFQHSPEHAKANLKKYLINLNVRKTISTHIISHLEGATPAEPDMAPPLAWSGPVATAETLQSDGGNVDGILAAVPPPSEPEIMDPLHIYTQREMEDTFRNMAPYFEGKESEQNWLSRDKSTTKLRRITKGNAPDEFHTAFVVGIKTLLDGILKVANSLRTTMSTNGCLLIQELAKTLRSSIDPWAEILLQNFIKMCAATKNIAAQNGNVTVDSIFSNATYSTRLLAHVSNAAQDKNVQPRTFSAGWVKALIRKHKTPIEHTGGLDLLEKTLKKGVTDANPKVREAYRSTYWTFALVWPHRADIIFETLDKREKSALERDPNNPNASLSSSQQSVSSFSKSVGAGSGAARDALKAKIAEQRRAKLAAAKGVPERPSSALATYSPVKVQSTKPVGSRTVSTMSAASSTSTRPPSALGQSTKSTLATNGTGSLMSGTARRPIRTRPELHRPATADPYAVRRTGKSTPSMTPEKTPAATTARKSAVPKDTLRARANTQNSPSVSPIRSKSRLGAGSEISSHRKTPTSNSPQGSPALTPSRDEDLTMVKPWVRLQNQHDSVIMPTRQRNGTKQTDPADPQDADAGDDDNLTMVIPSLVRPPSQLVQRSPPKSNPSPSRLAVASPRGSPLRSPKSMGHLGMTGPQHSPRIRSPDRPIMRESETYNGVQIYEDPFASDDATVDVQAVKKPVLEELPLNEKNADQKRIEVSDGVDTMSASSPGRQHGHHKTTSTGSVIRLGAQESETPEALKNRQLLASGVKKIQNRTVEAHMFRRMQDMVKSNQDIWGGRDEKFGELLLACLEYLETPTEQLKTPPSKAANLKVQALATIRAMLSLYRKETAKYFSTVLCTLLQTKAQYDNTSHIAMDLEATAEEIVRYGQTSDCLDAVLTLLEDRPEPRPTSSPNCSIPRPDADPSHDVTVSVTGRTTTMALHTLTGLLHVSAVKNVTLSALQTARLGKLVVNCLENADPDIRKADMDVCLALHERIGRDKEGFWKAVAGARPQHLNLLTYFLAKRART